jgi:protein-tyrosine phosphatase
MAEALLRRRMQERGVTGRVGSAGFLGSGHRATDDAIATMADIGVDLSGHRSRKVTADLLDGTDLVITMTRQHLIDIASLTPDGWERGFQIRDLVQRAVAVGPRGQPFETWLASVNSGRSRAGLLSTPLGDDIADPIGGTRADYQRTRDVLDGLLTRLAAVLG